jgi:hypothetical protein
MSSDHTQNHLGFCYLPSILCRWIAQQVEEILGKDDDVVIDFIYGMLEENRFVGYPVSLQILRRLFIFTDNSIA